MDTDTKLSFKGNSMHAKAIGLQHVKLLGQGEHYSMKRPDTHICSIMIGTMYIEHVGEMSLTNHKTGEVCIVKFFEEGWGGKNRHYIEGFVYSNAADAKKKREKDALMKISGKWSESISCVKMTNGKEVKGEEKEIWKASPAFAKSDAMYHFT